MIVSILEKQKTRGKGEMVIKGATGVLGLTSVVGGFGGAAFLLAAFIPAAGGAIAALVATIGLHSWVTRK
jgi:hypothetical protein